MALKAVNIDPKIIESEQIDGILNGFSIPSDAQGIALPNVKFWDGEKYISGFNDQTGEVIADNITDSSIRRVSIDVGEGKTRYFQQIDHRNGNAGISTAEGYKEGSGLKATAWQEIDNAGNPIKNAAGKQEIRISFTGFLGNNDGGALLDFIDGKLNPQATEAAVFTKEVIDKVGKDNISNIIYGSHSIGASNALVADVISNNLEGIPTKTALLIEPVGATLQTNKIKEALRDVTSPLSQQLQQLGYRSHEIIAAANSLDNDIKEHVISLRAIAKEDGVLHGSAMGNVNPGVGMANGWLHYLDPDRQDGVPSGKSPESNKMIGGTQILQDITPSLANPKAPINGVDPNHTLAIIVQDVKQGVYYQVADADIADKKPLQTPPKKPVQTEATIQTKKGNSI